MKKIRTEKNSLKNTILLEVGTEPLPANSIYPLAKQLKANIRSILKSNHIVFGGVETFDTYRRLVVFVKDVRELQEPREIEFRGPSKEMAFDEHNKATRAFLGFLKKNGLKEIDVEIKETSQGEYLYGKKKEPAKKTILMLPGLIKELVNSISCEKNMRWNGNYGFIRPIRWFLLLWNDTPVMFELAGVKSGGVTFGHQVLAPEPYRVKGAADYFREAKKHYVDIDFNERRRKIEKGVSALAAKRKGCLYFDPELLDELANLVECPGFISGSFNKKFLFLPDEVLMTSMKKGQKLFCVRDKKGGVMPAFLAVIDNRPAPSIKSRIRANYERVLEAKLKDSEFFLKQDIKTTLIDRVDFLKEIIFQKDLG
ncbi:MAG: glycine--tRNA ligase subunit beta, partial [Candidatus Omnitrophica bacterium]|nr:glycine--tRNA ligase subunit beta [Candidatus Omnitrophota bacterium]